MENKKEELPQAVKDMRTRQAFSWGKKYVDGKLIDLTEEDRKSPFYVKLAEEMAEFAKKEAARIAKYKTQPNQCKKHIALNIFDSIKPNNTLAEGSMNELRRLARSFVNDVVKMEVAKGKDELKFSGYSVKSFVNSQATKLAKVSEKKRKLREQLAKLE